MTSYINNHPSSPNNIETRDISENSYVIFKHLNCILLLRGRDEDHPSNRIFVHLSVASTYETDEEMVEDITTRVNKYFDTLVGHKVPNGTEAKRLCRELRGMS